MSGLDFDYVRARTTTDALHSFGAVEEQGRLPLYFAGGTEIITLSRLHQVNPDVVIDVKKVPALHEVTVMGDHLLIASAVTLTQLTNSSLIQREFPLLASTVAEIADRTARNKITFGGNLCGQIFYREAILPLLLCDTRLKIAGPKEGMTREVELWKVFRRSIHLQPGEVLMSTSTPRASRCAPFFHRKRRKAGRVGYPIVTVAAIPVQGKIRVAYSGVCAFPFRSTVMERELNRPGLPPQERVNRAIEWIPKEEVLNDFEASRSYRLAVLADTLLQALEELGG